MQLDNRYRFRFFLTDAKFAWATILPKLKWGWNLFDIRIRVSPLLFLSLSLDSLVSAGVGQLNTTGQLKTEKLHICRKTIDPRLLSISTLYCLAFSPFQLFSREVYFLLNSLWGEGRGLICLQCHKTIRNILTTISRIIFYWLVYCGNSSEP